MKPNEQLAPIFADANICEFDAYLLRTIVTPPRTVGSANFSTQLSAMMERELRLRLDGNVYVFVEARNVIRYIGSPQVDYALRRCDRPRVVSVQRIATLRTLTLLLVDEALGKALVVIGSHSLHLEPDGLTVKFETPNGASTEL